MKTTLRSAGSAIIAFAAIGLLLPGLTSTAIAQTVAGAPAFVDYQGMVFDGTTTDKPLGSTGTSPNYTAAPRNYTMQFKIYDAQSGGTLIWAETQTVTVSLGAFAVRLGSGAAISGLSPAPTQTSIGTAFNGKDRFLELTVVVTGTTGTPITPRLAFQSSPFSFVAQRAVLADSATLASSVNGVVTATAGSTFAGTVTGSLTGNVTGNVTGNATTATTATTAGNVTGIVAIANGGTGSNTKNFVDLTNPQNIAGTKNFTDSVGIGTPSPSAKLEVNGTVAARTTTASDGYIYLNPGSQTVTGWLQFYKPGPSPIAYLGNSAGGINNLGLNLQSNAHFNINGGNVGIGLSTTNPQVPLDVNGNTRITMADNGYYSNGHTASTVGGITTYTTTEATIAGGGGIDFFGMWGDNNFPVLHRFNAPVCIRGTGWIASSMGFVAFSDRRIKRDLQASVPAKDLATIRQLRVTDYRMVDPGDGGSSWRKGFIAQEVEEVIPEAVTRSTEFVPDIFSEAASLIWNPGRKTLFVTLKKDHELKAGDRVRLHMDGKRVDLAVSAAPSAREFEVEKCETAPQKLFVYGKQVNDFRTVDYDRIFTTSVGALQELKNEKDAEVKALQEENSVLRAALAAQEKRLVSLEAKDQARDAKLASIEKLLGSRDQPATRTISLQQGE